MSFNTKALLAVVSLNCWGTEGAWSSGWHQTALTQSYIQFEATATLRTLVVFGY